MIKNSSTHICKLQNRKQCIFTDHSFHPEVWSIALKFLNLRLDASFLQDFQQCAVSYTLITVYLVEEVHLKVKVWCCAHWPCWTKSNLPPQCCGVSEMGGTYCPLAHCFTLLNLLSYQADFSTVRMMLLYNVHVAVWQNLVQKFPTLTQSLADVNMVFGCNRLTCFTRWQMFYMLL